MNEIEAHPFHSMKSLYYADGSDNVLLFANDRNNNYNHLDLPN